MSVKSQHYPQRFISTGKKEGKADEMEVAGEDGRKCVRVRTREGAGLVYQWKGPFTNQRRFPDSEGASILPF